MMLFGFLIKKGRLKIRPRTTVEPELVATASFKVMQNQTGMDGIISSFSKENQGRAALELKFLSVFCRYYACQQTFQPEEEKQAILDEFSQFFPSQSECYFGLPFCDVKPKLADRIARYFGAVNTVHELGPPWNIGKLFAELCGLKNCSVTAYRGALWFTKEFSAAKESFDKIIEDYDISVNNE